MSIFKSIRLISIVWIIGLLSFLTGMYVIKTKVWPYQVIEDITNFVAGDVSEDTTLADKIENDLNLSPKRHITTLSDMTEFPLNKDAVELKGLPLKSRRENPRVYFSKKAEEGYRLISGVFDFEQRLFGAILLNSSGDVVRIWSFTQEHIPWNHFPDTNVAPQGIEIAPDGSIIVAYGNGTSLAKYDYCGNSQWTRPGGFHHSVDFDDNGNVWVWGDVPTPTVVREGRVKPKALVLLNIDYENGNVLKQIPLTLVMAVNSDIDIFGIRQQDDQTTSPWLGDFWHPNDVEDLPKALQQYFPGFNAGDLLVSLRSLNLIFVMDPETLRVKWWREGLTRRQHDPDWSDRGTITIFDNNMHRSFSRIVEINPFTLEYTSIVKGDKYSFYSRDRGNHQILPGGNILITSSRQGRVFELDEDGNIAFEFINIFSMKEGQEAIKDALVVSKAIFLPNDYFKELPKCH